MLCSRDVTTAVCLRQYAKMLKLSSPESGRKRRHIIEADSSLSFATTFVKGPSASAALRQGHLPGGRRGRRRDYWTDVAVGSFVQVIPLLGLRCPVLPRSCRSYATAGSRRSGRFGWQIHAVKARSQAMNQIKSLIVTGPAQLREQLRHLPTLKMIAACARLRPGHQTRRHRTRHQDRAAPTGPSPSTALSRNRRSRPRASSTPAPGRPRLACPSRGGTRSRQPSAHQRRRQL
jgi:hypothetical protein